MKNSRLTNMLIGAGLGLAVAAGTVGCAVNSRYNQDRITVGDIMQGGYDLKKYLEKNNEIDVLKDYKNGASDYWVTLKREVNALKKDHPEYADYDVIEMHRKLRAEGINYNKELQRYIDYKFNKKILPPEVDSVIELLEWENAQKKKSGYDSDAKAREDALKATESGKKSN